MNERHALFKACKKAWWDFLRSIIIMAALVYMWAINIAPWWFLTTSFVVLMLLCLVQVAENYTKIRREHSHIN